MSDIPLGRFVWYQLNTTDLPAAREFYTEIVGWKTGDWTGGDDPYTMFSRGQVPVGGAMALPPEALEAGAPQHWLAYISTPDVDKTVLQATDNGAQVFVPPIDLADVGRISVLADPQGAMIAVFAPTPGPQDTLFEPEIGDAAWHELITTDHVAAMEFYHTLFGWEKTDTMDMGDMGLYQMFGRKSKTLGGMFNKPADIPAPPHWMIYFRVEDVHDCVDRITERGGKILNGPMEVPGGDFVVQCMDPQGGVFALHSTI